MSLPGIKVLTIYALSIGLAISALVTLAASSVLIILFAEPALGSLGLLAVLLMAAGAVAPFFEDLS